MTVPAWLFWVLVVWVCVDVGQGIALWLTEPASRALNDRVDRLERRMSDMDRKWRNRDIIK